MNILASEQEGEVVVAEAVTDIECSVYRRVEPVVGEVARPDLVPYNCNALRSVFLYRPCSLERVLCERVKELVVEDAVISVD